MFENPDEDTSDLFEKIKDNLNKLYQGGKIEYYYYKNYTYMPEITMSEYNKAFNYFPYDEMEAFDKIQIFHEFYAIDVWGSYSPMQVDVEQYKYCKFEIEERIKGSSVMST